MGEHRAGWTAGERRPKAVAEGLVDRDAPPPERLGLTSPEARDRQQQWGPNEPATGRRSPLAQLLPLLGNPLALVLLVAAALSALLGETVDAAIIVVLVVFSVAINVCADVAVAEGRREAPAARRAHGHRPS